MTQGFTAQAGEIIFRLTGMDLADYGQRDLDYFRAEIEHLQMKEATILRQLTALAASVEVKAEAKRVKELAEKLERDATEADSRYIDSFVEERKGFEERMDEQGLLRFPTGTKASDLVEAEGGIKESSELPAGWTDEKLDAAEF